MNKLMPVSEFLEMLTYKLKNLSSDNSILKVEEERVYSQIFHVVTSLDSVGVKQRFLIPKYADVEVEHHIETVCPFCGNRYFHVSSRKDKRYGNVSYYANAQCGNCIARGPLAHAYSREEAERIARSLWYCRGELNDTRV